MKPYSWQPCNILHNSIIERELANKAESAVKTKVLVLEVKFEYSIDGILEGIVGQGARARPHLRDCWCQSVPVGGVGSAIGAGEQERDGLKLAKRMLLEKLWEAFQSHAAQD